MKDSLKKISADLAENLVAKFATPEMVKLISDTKAALDSETGTFEVVITTENIDRFQEIIKIDGWELEHYRANPVVLWGHDHNQLIGAATSIEVRDGKMIAKGKFAPTEFAQEKRKLYDFGILKATSVGFIEKEREGNVITKAELIEFSFVSVPANPYALSLAMQKELNINDLRRVRSVRNKCEYCNSRIEKHEDMALLYTENVCFPEIFRGVMFHPDCIKKELNKLLAKV